MTNIDDGIVFQVLPGPSNRYRIAWTAAGSENAWLALDRNGNGKIDDFTELFGNFTDQPIPPAGQMRNGFAALAVFDSRDHGGNGDGWISEKDLVYTQLRLWKDKNHNGISEPDELITLRDAGIRAISLSYSDAHYVDSFGNHYRYRSVVRDMHDSEVGPVAYDVFLTSQ